MKEKIAKIMTRFEGTAFYPYSSSVIEALSSDILSLIREEIKPQLEEIDGLVSDIVGDWTDPRYECRKISEKIQAILKVLES